MSPPRVCPLSHTVKHNGRWVRGENEALGVLIQGDGQLAFRLKCRRCGNQSSNLPKAKIAEWQPIKIEWVRQNPAIEYEQCAFLGCTKPGVEWHHFAPRNTFGDGADSWPMEPLCRDHHIQWHATMDGYAWNRKGG